METKQEQFELLMHWLLQEQKSATKLECKIDEAYKRGSSGELDLGSFDFISLKINLAAAESKIVRLKHELIDLAKLGI